MRGVSTHTYYAAKWPDPVVPVGEPVRFLYEVDKEADAVLRTIDIYPNGAITRNSIDLEQRNGNICPSLIDCSLDEGFAGTVLEQITREDFETLWSQGSDKPFWFVG